jgi:hypothetical protein
MTSSISAGRTLTAFADSSSPTQFTASNRLRIKQDASRYTRVPGGRRAGFGGGEVLEMRSTFPHGAPVASMRHMSHTSIMQSLSLRTNFTCSPVTVSERGFNRLRLHWPEWRPSTNGGDMPTRGYLWSCRHVIGCHIM